MHSAWLLPEDIADVLPLEARHIESLRRLWLDEAERHGFELVMPPTIEYLDSLLSGTDPSLDLRTFKLIDQLSGRTMGLRADITPQVARIDAHLLNRQGVARLCYCGSVVHTRADGPEASREPLQFGAELYGHAGIEAELEVLDLALEGLAASLVADVVVDLSDARIVKGVLNCTGAAAMANQAMEPLMDALTHKDRARVASVASTWPMPTRVALDDLMSAYGASSDVNTMRERLPRDPLVSRALDDLQALTTHLEQTHPGVRISVDLADVGGYAYYSGPRFALFAQGRASALVRGGRYDEVGAVFGRNRPAVGFALDLKALAAATSMAAANAGATAPRPAILAAWSDDPAQRQAVRRLRANGEVVIGSMPGTRDDDSLFDADRELVSVAGQWVVKARCA